MYAKGNGKISLLGGSQVSTDEIDSREITARVTMDKNKSVELFDYSSGDYFGTRELSDSNNFFFRNFNWQFDGNLVDDDAFNVLNSTARKDDASNLLNMSKLAELSEASGKGGYNQIYTDLVVDVGFNVRSSEQGLETSKIIYDAAVDRKSNFWCRLRYRGGTFIRTTTSLSSTGKSSEYCKRNDRHSSEVYVIWRIKNVCKHNPLF